MSTGTAARWVACVGVATACLLGAACTQVPPGGGAAPAPPRLDPGRPVTLLGEVHDNAAGHAVRLRAFDALLARGARPALVLEQFDRADQAVLDAALRRVPPPSAAELIATVQASKPAGSTAGWTWAYYEPFIERALRHGLPIVAANVGRDEARRVMREGLAALGFDAAVPDDILAGLAATIEASHCGQVDNALARRMALAQVARDQQMARAVSAHATSRGAVLLAGNGHVRNDLGVPRWLDAATRARAQSVGVLEAGDPAKGDPARGDNSAAAFDIHIAVPPQPRPDPCGAMRRTR